MNKIDVKVHKGTFFASQNNWPPQTAKTTVLDSELKLVTHTWYISTFWNPLCNSLRQGPNSALLKTECNVSSVKNLGSLPFWIMLRPTTVESQHVLTKIQIFKRIQSKIIHKNIPVLKPIKTLNGKRLYSFEFEKIMWRHWHSLNKKIGRNLIMLTTEQFSWFQKYFWHFYI